MTIAMQCPDRASLEHLLGTGAGPDEVERLAGHLETCVRCGEMVETLLAADRTATALRGATVEPEGSSVQLLRARLANLRPATGAAASQDSRAGEDTFPAVPLPVPSPFGSAPEASVPLAPPQQPDEIGRLGGYRILKELGRGGMGVVYQAEDPKLKRLVALKVMLPRLAADADMRQRFLREAQAMAALRHDHIVTIFQVDEADGVPFLAMEFLQGAPLDQWLKDDRKPTVAEVLRIGREIAEGLAAAHERGLIHRDVKPGNVWLESAHSGRVKVLDFGLARPVTEDVHLTHSGAIVGTPAYMAPEQARAEKVDARSDLFSLGCVLYRLCTGVLPFAGDTMMALLTALAMDNPKLVREINADIPTELSDMVMSLLEKNPARRPASAREVVQSIHALETLLAQKREAAEKTEALRADSPPALAVRAAPAPPRRRRLLLIAAAAMVLAGLIGLGAAALIRIQTDHGDYVIDTDDPDFFFQVHDGAVKLEDRKNNKTYTLKVVKQDKDAKEVEMEVSDGGALAFKTKTFTIKRGEKAALTAWFEPKGVAANPSGQVDDAWVKQVAAMPADKQVEAVVAELKNRNPDFDGKIAPGIEGGVVTELQFLAYGVTDVSPVKALTGLRALRCNGTQGAVKAPLADLSSLKGLKLVWLNCSSTYVSDLAPLKDMKLTYLDCSATKVSDLVPLKGMPLTHLEFGSTKVSDLTPLKGMKLTYLNCGVNKVSDLAPLDGMPLEVLLCSNLTVSDLSPLRGMPLKSILCDFKPERDAAILRSIQTLETINGKPAAEFWKDVGAKKP